MLEIFDLQDSLSPGVGDAVKKCLNACINIRMITNESLDTARFNALKSGILPPHDNNYSDTEDY